MNIFRKFPAGLLLCVVFILIFFTGSISDLWASRDNRITVSGSTVLMPAVREAAGMYEVISPGVRFSFHETGSVIGQAQVASGAAHLAVSDLPIVPDYQTYPLLEINFVRLPVTFLSNQSMIRNLSTQQIKGIYNGQYHNWKEFGGPDLPIIVVLRSDFSGITRVMRDWLQGTEDPVRSVRVSTNPRALEQVASIPGALSAVGGLPANGETSILSIDGCMPGTAVSSECEYPLFYYGRIILHNQPSVEAAKFISFFLSQEVQERVLSGTSLTPVSPLIPKEIEALTAHIQQTQLISSRGLVLSGQIFAGIALFLVGVRFISSSLKKVANRRIKKLFSRWSDNLGVGALWGFLSGAVAQSSSSAAFVLTGMVAGNIMKMKSALYILSWAEIGTTLLVFLATWNLNLAILYFLSISGLLYAFDKKGKHQQILLSMFGLGLLLFGFDMIKSTAADLAQTLWVQNLMTMGTELPILLFLLGAVLRTLTQSSSTVALLAIPMAHAGILDLSQVLLTFFGAAAGSGISGIILSSNISGMSRQVALVKSMADFISSIGLVMLLQAGTVWGNNTIDMVFQFFGNTIEEKAAWGFLFVKAMPGLIMLSLTTPLKRMAEQFSPPSRVETLARLKFVQENALQDPDTALQLTARESERIVSRLPSYLQHLRTEEADTQVLGRLEELHQAAQELNSGINEIFTELFGQDMRKSDAELLIIIQNQHKIQENLETQLYELTLLLGQDLQNPELAKVQHSMIEGLHTILAVAAESAEKADPQDLRMLLNMTGDRSGLVAGMRKSYLSGSENISAHSRSTFLHMTNVYQRVVWLLHSWTESRIKVVEME
ncbi:Na/Pi symporter [Desulfonatronovibrio magnus]|uniref:Na/Pi symporter n=1 Tax=Desulfonatronovibrio magnus TaxID=698827 RepID=UPI0005EBDED1|nr:Na/Pi symporter [Desulfonatronovibrio magnus]